ncbi:MAG TPA: cellulase family glycosylhydrolase [Cyclobacteriaceae bacterium]
MKKSILLLLLSACVYIASAQGFLTANGKTITNEKGEKIILRGVGLGGWMLQEGYMLRVNGIGQQQHVVKTKIEELVGKEKTEEFYNAWLANHTRKIDIDSMAKWGFNSVRLPIHYNLYTLPVEQEPVAGQNTWLEKGFKMTDELLQWCKANKIYLILDLHAAPGGQGNDLNISDRDPSKPSLWQSEANQQKTIALWKKLAERYKDESWVGAYDIINEPNWGFEKAEDKNGCGESKNEPLRKLMVDITTAIREIDKKHIIIIEGNCWGNNYNGVFPLWDNNTVISFHKYWNYNDKASVQKFLDIREQFNAPVWLGESGENSNVWFRDAISLMESNKIGWAWWPLKKLGFNNPLEVKVPTGYQKILDFWSGKGTQPSADEAYQGLMELADNLKLENNIYHKDVIDAMFRQVRSNEAKPFKEYTASSSPIWAVDYDLGRNRYAYYDKDTANYYISTGKERTAGNLGGVYRNDGVDIKAEKDNSTNYYVDHFETAEWLQYSIKADGEGKYKLQLTVSAENTSGKILLTVNAKDIKNAVAVPNTNGQWQTVESAEIKLKQGNNVIRVKAQSGGFNFKSIALKSDPNVLLSNPFHFFSAKIYWNLNCSKPNDRYFLRHESFYRTAIGHLYSDSVCSIQ